ncbi:MAG: ACT domain-containing protein [Candidatus Omnitrophota bacterium]
MIKAKMATQLMVTVDNKIGALSEVSGLLAENGINLLAACGYITGPKGWLMFVCEDAQKAKDLLLAKQIEVREEEVILATLDNKPGALSDVAEKIATAGIDITLLYASAEKSARSSTVILITENNKLALAVLKQ